MRAQTPGPRSAGGRATGRTARPGWPAGVHGRWCPGRTGGEKAGGAGNSRGIGSSRLWSGRERERRAPGAKGLRRAKKNPGSRDRSGIALFYPQNRYVPGTLPSSQSSPQGSGRSSDSRFILLAAPSRLEISDKMQRSSPVTAAGPSPIRTEFPFKFLAEHLNRVKRNPKSAVKSSKFNHADRQHRVGALAGRCCWARSR